MTLIMKTALVILMLALAAQASAETAPDWTLAKADGTTIQLATAADERTTVLFFWATWCPYCKALMPHLQSIKLEFGDDVQILAINIKDDGDPVGFIDKAGYDFELLLEGDEVAAAYGIHGTPGLMLLDGGRTVHFDLRTLPRREIPPGQSKGHTSKAAYRAPYWSAALRQALDKLRD